jgi:hypothetical protein
LNEYNVALDKFLGYELKPYLIRVGLMERMIIWKVLAFKGVYTSSYIAMATIVEFSVMLSVIFMVQLRIVSNCFCDDLAARNCNCNCFCDNLATRNYDLAARNCLYDDFA